MQNYISVSQVNKYVHSLLDSDYRLKDVYIKGEISNLSFYPRTGTFYLSLKDSESQIKAVIFKSNAMYLSFIPQNGMNVIARGNITLYEKDGTYQLIISELIPEGIGSSEMLLKQLKEKLTKEGIFDPSKKLLFPKKISTIAVVTSEQGAVIHDIISVVSRKKPYMDLLLSPANVQGENTAFAVIKALDRILIDKRADIVIIARGGGSREDLWGFQNEELVRKVSSFPIPVISAIGHETDYTLCDLAASFRAATPTAAAEIACGSCMDINDYLELIGKNLYTNLCGYVEKYTEKLYNYANKLDILNPLNVLTRGFSITKPNSILKIKVDDTIETILKDGKIKSKVTEVIKNDL